MKEVSVVILSAIWKHFTASCLEKKKHKQTRDCLIDIMYMYTDEKSTIGPNFFYQPHCFLREFPVALDFFFKINLNGQNHLCTDGT